uniref:Neurobeachin n=1 Tax=Accipiter nisus TaxID=211598 RepID=A0A8B9M8P9_9AVES
MASEEKQVVQPTGDDGGGGGGEGGSGGGAGKEGNAAEGGSVLQPLNPGVPIRGIKMKFAVLTGLVEVGEVSNRDIVETVFNLVS